MLALLTTMTLLILLTLHLHPFLENVSIVGCNWYSFFALFFWIHLYMDHGSNVLSALRPLPHQKKKKKNPNKSCNLFTSSMFRVHIYIFFIGKCTGKIYIKKRKWRPKANPNYTRSIQEAPKGKNKKKRGYKKFHQPSSRLTNQKSWL